MLLRRFNWFESTPIQTNNHATSEPHTHVKCLTKINKFPLKNSVSYIRTLLHALGTASKRDAPRRHAVIARPHSRAPALPSTRRGPMFQKKPIAPIQPETLIVTATVRTRSVASASAASAAVTQLLENPSKTTATFRMPVKSVEQLPTVVSEAAPHSPNTRRRLNLPPSPSTMHPLTGPELQQAIVDALTFEEGLISPREEKKKSTPQHGRNKGRWR